MTLEYFGKLSDLAGVERETVGLPAHVADTSGLRAWLAVSRGWGSAIEDSKIRIAINDALCIEPSPIQSTDKIGFLPPVGGG